MTIDKAPTEVTPAPARRVVVGYDGSAGSHAALERAVDDGVVFVVHAYALPHSWLGRPNYQERLDAALDDADSTISELWERTGPLRELLREALEQRHLRSRGGGRRVAAGIWLEIDCHGANRGPLRDPVIRALRIDERVQHEEQPA